MADVVIIPVKCSRNRSSFSVRSPLYVGEFTGGSLKESLWDSLVVAKSLTASAIS